METKSFETNDTKCADTPRIEVLETGPYVLYGEPELHLQFIETDAAGIPSAFRKGRSFVTRPEPVHLCRCGGSKNKPYCDGSHTRESWNPALTPPHELAAESVTTYDGPGVTLLDDERYCVLARFCDVGEGIWQAVGYSDDPTVRKEILREADLCPGGRLKAIDKITPREMPEQSPELGLIEDPGVQASGGLRLQGGIPVVGPDGTAYAVRDRAVLCRCGKSRNKPYCDGSHLRAHWQDGLAEAAVEHAKS